MRREPDMDDEELELEDDVEDAEVEVFEEGGASWLVGFATGILVGAFVGAGVMLLAAPDRGEVTRRRLRRRVRDMGDDARGHLEDLGEEASHQLARHRRRLKKRLRRRS